MIKTATFIIRHIGLIGLLYLVYGLVCYWRKQLKDKDPKTSPDEAVFQKRAVAEEIADKSDLAQSTVKIDRTVKTVLIASKKVDTNPGFVGTSSKNDRNESNCKELNREIHRTGLSRELADLESQSVANRNIKKFLLNTAEQSESLKISESKPLLVETRGSLLDEPSIFNNIDVFDGNGSAAAAESNISDAGKSLISSQNISSPYVANTKSADQTLNEIVDVYSPEQNFVSKGLDTALENSYLDRKQSISTLDSSTGSTDMDSDYYCLPKYNRQSLHSADFDSVYYCLTENNASRQLENDQHLCLDSSTFLDTSAENVENPKDFSDTLMSLETSLDFGTFKLSRLNTISRVPKVGEEYVLVNGLDKQNDCIGDSKDVISTPDESNADFPLPPRCASNKKIHRVGKDEKSHEFGNIEHERGIPSSIAYHSRQELTEIPKLAANTKQLLLNDNKISKIIPTAFSNLHSLTLLNLCGNSIPVLPTEITHLISLEFLYLRKNTIRELPKGFENLVNLQICDIAENCLSKLYPSCFANCLRLQILDLSYNRLQELPSSIGLLKSLRTLLVHENSFTLAFSSLVEPLIKSYQLILSGKLRSSKDNRHPGHGYLLRLQGHLADQYDLEISKIKSVASVSKFNVSFGNLEITRAPQSEKARNVIAEILETEKTYCYELHIVKQLYQIPLYKSNIFREHELSLLFANLDDIRELHSEIVLQKLMQVIKSGQSVGIFFSALCPVWTSYVKYLNNFDWSNSIVNHLENLSSKKISNVSILSWLNFTEDHRAAFTHIKTQAKFSPLHTQLNLSAYLVLPVQRLPRYKLFMDALVKATATDHPDYQNLINAQKSIVDLVTHCNESKREWEKQMISLQPLFELSVPTEPYSSLLMSWTVGRKCLARFEDLRIVKYVELCQNHGTKSISPTILCNGKKQHYSMRRICRLEECKFKVSKSLNAARYAKAIERNGNISRYDVAFTAGKSCMVFVCNDVLLLSNSQRVLSGCIKIPLSSPATFIPMTAVSDDLNSQEAVARLTDGNCVIFLKGSIDSISQLITILNSLRDETI